MNTLFGKIPNGITNFNLRDWFGISQLSEQLQTIF